jgi:hypothetical protein
MLEESSVFPKLPQEMNSAIFDLLDPIFFTKLLLHGNFAQGKFAGDHHLFLASFHPTEQDNL